MVTWKQSFLVAGRSIKYALGWWAIGLLVFIYGYLNVLQESLQSLITGNDPSNWFLLYGCITLGGIGIIVLGTIASMFKIFASEILLLE